jgi:hypothetical protein
MATTPRRREGRPIEDPAGDCQPMGETDPPREAPTDRIPEQTPPNAGEETSEARTMQALIEKARRFVTAELELAEMRRQVAETNVALTEAQLQLAETQIEELKAENERLRQQIIHQREANPPSHRS